MGFRKAGHFRTCATTVLPPPGSTHWSVLRRCSAHNKEAMPRRWSDIFYRRYWQHTSKPDGYARIALLNLRVVPMSLATAKKKRKTGLPRMSLEEKRYDTQRRGYATVAATSISRGSNQKTSLLITSTVMEGG